MLDYKSIIRLKKLGLSHGAIATRIGCKWESVQRIVTRCENEWGDLEKIPGVPPNRDSDFPFNSGLFSRYWRSVFPCMAVYIPISNGVDRSNIRTSGSAGGLLCGYKNRQLLRFTSLLFKQVVPSSRQKEDCRLLNDSPDTSILSYYVVEILSVIAVS